MPTLDFSQTDKNIYKNGAIVGETDLVVKPTDGYFIIPDILVKGDLNGELEYVGKAIVIEQIEMIVGMEIGQYGARGPVWKNVKARILR